MLARLAVSSPDQQGYSLHEGVIKLNNRIWVGQNSALQTKIISAIHSSTVGGHSGHQATYHRVKKCSYGDV